MTPLQQHHNKEFTYEQMTALIGEFDMFECETDEGLAVALTNQITGDPTLDYGEFYLFTKQVYTPLNFMNNENLLLSAFDL